jgi:hypothetical protein
MLLIAEEEKNSGSSDKYVTDSRGGEKFWQ